VEHYAAMMHVVCGLWSDYLLVSVYAFILVFRVGSCSAVEPYGALWTVFLPAYEFEAAQVQVAVGIGSAEVSD
jgi:hypothetical protein